MTINNDKTSFDFEEIVDRSPLERQTMAEFTQKVNELGPIDFEKIRSGEGSKVDFNHLYAVEITAADIKADTITANEISADSITANEIASRTITANEIVSGTITANEVEANTLTANEIDVDDIFAEDITATGEITGGTITGAFIRTSTSGHRIELVDSSNNLDIYNPDGNKTILLDGSATTIDGTQVKIGGSLFLSGDLDVDYSFGTQQYPGGFGGGGIASFTKALGDGSTATFAVRSDGEVWHYGTGSLDVVRLTDSGDVYAEGNIRPYSDNSGQIGESSYRWNSAYITNGFFTDVESSDVYTDEIYDKSAVYKQFDFTATEGPQVAEPLGLYKLSGTPGAASSYEGFIYYDTSKANLVFSDGAGWFEVQASSY